MVAPQIPLDPTEIIARLTEVKLKHPRWTLLLADTAAFIDRWLPAARREGWSDLELWALDPWRPFASDEGRHGLVTGLAGRHLLGFTREWALIAGEKKNVMHNRGLQVASRDGPRLIPAWECGGYATFSQSKSTEAQEASP
jgi:hypothetical protein